MALPYNEWVNNFKIKYADITVSEMNQLLFFRDPARGHIMDNNYFYSPADGVIIYQKIVLPSDPIEIKGKYYNIEDLVEKTIKFDTPCLVLGIFMSFLDVHINRAPYSGILTFKLLPPISTFNSTMDFAEDDFLAQKFNHNVDMDYEKYNARMINTFYIPSLNYRYYLLQIADHTVNDITHYTVNQNQWYHQTDRFSTIRYGSMVDLILPLSPILEFNTIYPNHYHVEAGVDKLININRK